MTEEESPRSSESWKGNTLGLTEDWRKALVDGVVTSNIMRRVFRVMPASPRCSLCLVPFAGVGGRFWRMTGKFARSRKNPKFCNMCFEEAPLGGAEVPTAILFADIRGYTGYSESRAPEEVAQLLNRFYRVATDVLADQNAIIDKLVGDQVMALFVQGFAGRDYVENSVVAAENLLRGVGFGSKAEPWLSIGIGLDFGTAFVGNVGATDEVKDFTAIGDVVNVAARLQAQARPGQIVLSDSVRQAVPDRYPTAQPVELQLRGRDASVRAWIVDFAAARAAA
jgi:adenylate cyclase